MSRRAKTTVHVASLSGAVSRLLISVSVAALTLAGVVAYTLPI